MGRKQRRRWEAQELERAAAVERPWLGAADLARMAANMGISVEQFERHTRSLQAKGFMEVRQRFDAARGETLTQFDDHAFFPPRPGAASDGHGAPRRAGGRSTRGRAVATGAFLEREGQLRAGNGPLAGQHADDVPRAVRGLTVAGDALA